jgi:hypothetical protein
LCRAAGGEFEQIQLLLGHTSVQTTERYLGTRQDLVHAPNYRIKLTVAAAADRPVTSHLWECVPYLVRCRFLTNTPPPRRW